jgi:hypothetical protein
MASIAKEIVTSASVEAAWDAIRDVGALHTRLVPGFVVATELIPGGRRVTFGNGLVVDEPIIDSNDELHRLAWTAVSDAMPLTHYNSSVQVFERDGGSRIVWRSDLLPDEAAETVDEMMEQGAAVMARTLNDLRAARPPAARTR